jgi:SAM-dependent methyltransferase
MPEADAGDSWDGAAAYDRFMGRWSRELARAFVRWLEVPERGHWLEVGCGTGALTSAICDLGAPTSVVASEPSETFISHARETIADPRVRFSTAGAGELPARAGGYDAVVSSLVLNFLPDPVSALREMCSLAAPGGVVAASVWDYAGGMQLLRRFWDAATELDPVARDLDEGRRFPLCAPAALTEAFDEAGLSSPQVEELVIETRFADFEDYWQPFLGGAGPAPTYVAGLEEEGRRALADRLSRTLPRGQDGSIRLAARAWAVRASGEARPTPRP